MKTLSALVLGFVLMAAPALAASATGEPIKIGEMMPYTNGPSFAVPFREGWQIALEQINKEGGVHGRPVEIVSRDDQADPAVAVRIAEELVSREKVVMLIGAGFDNVGLAVGNYANRYHVPLLKQWAGSCGPIEDPQNTYWFNTTPCYGPYARIFAREAAKLPYKKWAMIGPNYEFGHAMNESFKAELQRLRPDVVFVSERYPAVSKINAAAEIRAIDRTKPDAIFSTIFSGDLASYLLHAQKVGFLKDKYCISGTNIGSKTSIKELGTAYPAGWLTEGVPQDTNGLPVDPFVKLYESKYGQRPDLMAIYGYQILLVAVDSLRKAKSLNGEDIRNALENAKIDGPFGPVQMKNRQLYPGFWLGHTDNQNGKGSMVNLKWHSPEDLFPEAFQTTIAQ